MLVVSEIEAKISNGSIRTWSVCRVNEEADDVRSQIIVKRVQRTVTIDRQAGRPADAGSKSVSGDAFMRSCVNLSKRIKSVTCFLLCERARGGIGYNGLQHCPGPRSHEALLDHFVATR